MSKGLIISLLTNSTKAHKIFIQEVILLNKNIISIVLWGYIIDN